MKMTQIVLPVCMFLGGCSNVPDAADAEGVVKDAWSACNLVKPIDFKKTNGVDRGNNVYQIAISYKLEIVRDIADEDIWSTKVPKYIEPNINNSMSYSDSEKELNENNLLNANYYAATQRIEKFYAENCPHPISIKFQEFADRNNKHGTTLKKGDTLEGHTELTMVKSENGWIPQ
jgi:hypothetical protein